MQTAKLLSTQKTVSIKEVEQISDISCFKLVDDALITAHSIKNSSVPAISIFLESKINGNQVAFGLKNRTWRKKGSTLKLSNLLPHYFDSKNLKFSIEVIESLEFKSQTQIAFLINHIPTNLDPANLYGYDKSILLLISKDALIKATTRSSLLLELHERIVNFPYKISAVEFDKSIFFFGTYLGNSFFTFSNFFAKSAKKTSTLAEKLEKERAQFLEKRPELKNLSYDTFYNSVSKIKFINNSKTLIEGHLDGSVKIFDIETQTLRYHYKTDLLPDCVDSVFRLISDRENEYRDLMVKNIKQSLACDDPKAPVYGYIFVFSSRHISMFSLSEQSSSLPMFNMSFYDFEFTNQDQLVDYVKTDELSDKNLVTFAWQNGNSFIFSLFDVNQWYYSQLPSRYSPDFKTSFISHWRTDFTTTLKSENQAILLSPLSESVESFAKVTNKRRLSTDIFYQPDSKSLAGSLITIERESLFFFNHLIKFNGRQQQTLQMLRKKPLDALLTPRMTCLILEKCGILSPTENGQNIDTVLDSILLSHKKLGQELIRDITLSLVSAIENKDGSYTALHRDGSVEQVRKEIRRWAVNKMIGIKKMRTTTISKVVKKFI